MEKKSEECLKTLYEPFHFHSIKLQDSHSPDNWYCEALYQAKVNFLPLAQLMPNFLPLARNGYDQTLETILS